LANRKPPERAFDILKLNYGIGLMVGKHRDRIRGCNHDIEHDLIAGAKCCFAEDHISGGNIHIGVVQEYVERQWVLRLCMDGGESSVALQGTFQEEGQRRRREQRERQSGKYCTTGRPLIFEIHRD
jgi:hypothetical protein